MIYNTTSERVLSINVLIINLFKLWWTLQTYNYHLRSLHPEKIVNCILSFSPHKHSNASDKNNATTFSILLFLNRNF